MSKPRIEFRVREDGIYLWLYGSAEAPSLWFGVRDVVGLRDLALTLNAIAQLVEAGEAGGAVLRPTDEPPRGVAQA